MKIYCLERKSILNANADKVWDFFSTPYNLNKITPPDMSFIIHSDLEGKKIYPGMIILYTVKPFLNLPMKWTTEITHCEEGRYFIDEQRSGPYSFWQHQHHFRSVDGGVEMTDIVYYSVGFGFIGRIMNDIYVSRRLQSIFDYREQVIKELFSVSGK